MTRLKVKNNFVFKIKIIEPHLKKFLSYSIQIFPWTMGRSPPHPVIWWDKWKKEKCTVDLFTILFTIFSFGWVFVRLKIRLKWGGGVNVRKKYFVDFCLNHLSLVLITCCELWVILKNRITMNQWQWADGDAGLSSKMTQQT